MCSLTYHVAAVLVVYKQVSLRIASIAVPSALGRASIYGQQDWTQAYP